MTSPHASDGPPNLLLRGERVECSIDADLGALPTHRPEGEVLTVTNRRAIKLGASAGVRTTSLIPLGRITGVEVLDVSRPTDRLGQGILLLVVGLALGGISWAVVNVPVVSLLLGGIPVLAAVYALAGWAFPNAEGELRIHAPGQTISQPLRSPAARRDAYRAAQRVYELIAEPRAEQDPVGAPSPGRARDTDRPDPDGPAPPNGPSRMPNPLENAVIADLGRARGGPPQPVAAEPAEEHPTREADA